MFSIRDIYSFSHKEFDPNIKILVKSSSGDYTGLDFEVCKETETEICYLAKLSNEKQTVLADLWKQIPKYRTDKKDVKFIFPDELQGLSVMAYDPKLALETFGKDKDYLVIATFDDLMKIIKKKRIFI